MIASGSARHYSAKYGGHDQYSRDYLKLHARLSGRRRTWLRRGHGDGQGLKRLPQFLPLMKAGAPHFSIAEVSADKAYSGHGNIDAVTAIGAKPFIPFRSNAFPALLPQAEQRGVHVSAMKRLFRDTLRSKRTEAQTNEVLLTVIAYNITCMVHSIFELGVTIPALSACTQTAIAAHEVG